MNKYSAQMFGTDDRDEEVVMVEGITELSNGKFFIYTEELV
jgi:hypothetical protein